MVQPLAETVPSLAVRRAVPLKGCRARRWREHCSIRPLVFSAAALLTEVTDRGEAGVLFVGDDWAETCDTRSHGASGFVDWRSDDVVGDDPGPVFRASPRPDVRRW